MKLHGIEIQTDLLPLSCDSVLLLQTLSYRLVSIYVDPNKSTSYLFPTPTKIFCSSLQ